MINVSGQGVAEALSVGRPQKLTPERLQQIINLVERQKSPAEIAELVGVPVRSLSVTCSRLGISLRRPPMNNGVRLGRPLRLASTTGSNEPVPEPPETETAREVETPAESETGKPIEAELMLTLKYNGKECTYQLPLTPALIPPLALKAEMRGLRLGEFISRVVAAALRSW